MKQRITVIDAIRGLAMFAVCASHFSVVLLPKKRELAYALTNAGYIASPLFLVVSGAVSGLFARLNRHPMATLGVILVDRGLFLILVGHMIIAALNALALVSEHTWSGSIFHSLYITDVIGVGLCLSPLTLKLSNRNPGWLLTLSIILYGCSWLAALSIPFVSSAWTTAMTYLFGANSTAGTTIDFSVPIVPYLALIFAGQAAGSASVKALSTQQGQLRLAVKMIQAGVVAAFIALTLKYLWFYLRPLEETSAFTAWAMTFSPLQKIPPGPNYLLFFGGAGITMAGILLAVDGRKIFTHIVSLLSVTGRSSLFVFLLQFLVFWYLVPKYMQWLLARAWPACFILSVMVLWCAAYVWDRLKGNRWFTIGLRALFTRTTAPPSSKSA